MSTSTIASSSAATGAMAVYFAVKEEEEKECATLKAAGKECPLTKDDDGLVYESLLGLCAVTLFILFLRFIDNR